MRESCDTGCRFRGLFTVLVASLATVACHGTLRTSARPVPLLGTSNALVGVTSSEVFRAEAFPGQTAGRKIAAAIAALPDSGGIVDATGLDGPQLLDVDVFASFANRQYERPAVSVSSVSMRKRSPGRLVFNPRARYIVLTTQHVPSGWSLEGYDPLWAVADITHARFTLSGFDGPTFDIVGAHHVVLRGIDIDCATIPGSVGMHYDATNQTRPGTPASGQALFEHLGIDNCEKAFEWGNARFPDPHSNVRASPVNDWGDDSQADTSYIRWVQIRSELPGAIGFFINGANKANLSAIEHVTLEGVTYGFYLASLAPALRVDDIVGKRLGFRAGSDQCLTVADLPADGRFGRTSLACGGSLTSLHGAPPPSLFYLAPMDILIRRSRSGGGCARFLSLDVDPCGAYLAGTITLERNTLTEPIEAGPTSARILSIANSGTAAHSDGDSIFVTSVGDSAGLWKGKGHIAIVPSAEATTILRAMAPFDDDADPQLWDLPPTYPLTATEAAVSVRADLQLGADAGEKIAAAIRSLPARGGTVDATGLVGYQELRRDVFAGAAGKPGRLVLSPSLSAQVFVSQRLPSDWSIEGHPGGFGTGGDPAFGTVLSAAPGTTPILQADGVTSVRIYGLQLLCPLAAGVTGIHIAPERASPPTRPSRGVSVLDMLGIYGCSTGIDWSTDPPAGERASAASQDRLWIKATHVRSRNGVSTGLRISGSAAGVVPLNRIDGLLVQEVTYGIDVSPGAPPLAIRELGGGSVGITPSPSARYECLPPASFVAGAIPPTVLLVRAGAPTRLALVNSQSEGGCGRLLTLDGEGPTADYPILLYKDTFDEPVVAEAQPGAGLAILSAANRGDASVTAEGDDVSFTSLEDARGRPRPSIQPNEWTCLGRAHGTRLSASDGAVAQPGCAAGTPSPSRQAPP